jgi:C2 domain of PTEN tumour-suppressor protein
MLAASYLLHSGGSLSADEAVSIVCQQRTPQSNRALSVPSQIRYVNYYEKMLRVDEVICYTYRLSHIRLTTIPNFDASVTSSGCVPYVIVSLQAQKENEDAIKWQARTIFNQLTFEKKESLRRYGVADQAIDFDISRFNVDVRGDVTLSFFSLDEKMCQVCFHTAFIEENYLVFDKSVVDLACDDISHRTFEANFKIEVFLSRVEDLKELNLVSNSDEELLLSLTMNQGEIFRAEDFTVIRES